MSSFQKNINPENEDNDYCNAINNKQKSSYTVFSKVRVPTGKGSRGRPQSPTTPTLQLVLSVNMSGKFDFNSTINNVCENYDFYSTINNVCDY